MAAFTIWQAVTTFSWPAARFALEISIAFGGLAFVAWTGRGPRWLEDYGGANGRAHVAARLDRSQRSRDASSGDAR